MIILHDGTSGDLSHVEAMANLDEGFALFDYVRIEQQHGNAWIGQIVEPNRNISTVNSNRLDPTILHGLTLMQNHPNVQSVESVQVFEIKILGEYDGRQLLTPRLRPLPGAIVTRLDASVTSQVIGIPQIKQREDGTSNVIGELLNAADVPLCIDVNKFNYHIMVAGGTGSGKSNVSANLIDQALKFGKCVLLHDAKPDYGLVSLANTDSNVTDIWRLFQQYGLQPHNASNLRRVGFYRACNPDSVDIVVGFYASDFSPEMLAGLFFTGTNEQNQFEGFASAADSLRELVRSGDRQSYSLDDIYEWLGATQEGVQLYSRLFSSEKKCLGVMKNVKANPVFAKFARALRQGELYIVETLEQHLSQSNVPNKNHGETRNRYVLEEFKNGTARQILRGLFKPRKKAFGFEVHEDHLEDMLRIMAADCQLNNVGHEIPFLLNRIDEEVRKNFNPRILQDRIAVRMATQSEELFFEETNERSFR